MILRVVGSSPIIHPSRKALQARVSEVLRSSKFPAKLKTYPKTYPKMLQLPNNCRAGDFSITPKNWDKPNAPMNVKWKISYWFYDDNLSQRKKIVIERFNRVKTLKDKQKAMHTEIVQEKELLSKKGYNYITGKSFEDEKEISERTSLLKALEYSLKNHHGDTDTKTDIRSSLKYISQAAKTLNYDTLPVGQVDKKHIKFILEEMANIKTYTDKKGNEKPKVWNDRMYNHTRAILSLLFAPLEEIDAVNINPVKGVKKRKKLKKIRQTPTEKDRELLRTLKEINYPFFRLIQIFHHSGGRMKELLAVKKKDVTIDLSHKNPAKHIQEYKITLKKGNKYEEVMKQIKDIALPYWQEMIALAVDNNQYLISAGLVPGYNGGKPIRREQITRRWNLHVKKKLGITADFYSLKHLNITEMMDIIKDEKEVAKLTAHTVKKDNNTMAKVYDMNNQKRKDDILKSINNPL